MSTEETSSAAVETVPELESTATSESVENGSQEEQEPRTFTQEELDAAVTKRLAKEQRKWQRDQAQALEAHRRAPATPPNPDQFETAADYVEALSEYKAEAKIAEREQRQQRTKIESTYADREEEVRAKYDDYQEVAYNDDLTISPAMAESIMSSEVGPEVLYHLGNNPKEAARIAKLPPLQQAREIGKLEVSLNASPPVKRTSSAPDPIKPIGSRSHTPTYDPTDPRSVKMAPSEWIEARNRQIAKRAQG